MSEASRVGDPSVSTAARLRTMAWRSAIWLAPGARLAVATTGRDSGAAARARPTAVSNISSKGPLLCRPMPIDSACRPTTLAARY